jgi:hypothetical protein
MSSENRPMEATQTTFASCWEGKSSSCQTDPLSNERTSAEELEMAKTRKHSGHKSRKTRTSKKRMTRRMRGGQTFDIGDIVILNHSLGDFKAKVIATPTIPGDAYIAHDAHELLYPILKNEEGHPTSYGRYIIEFLGPQPQGRPTMHIMIKDDLKLISKNPEEAAIARKAFDAAMKQEENRWQRISGQRKPSLFKENSMQNMAFAPTQTRKKLDPFETYWKLGNNKDLDRRIRNVGGPLKVRNIIHKQVLPGTTKALGGYKIYNVEQAVKILEKMKSSVEAAESVVEASAPVNASINKMNKEVPVETEIVEAVDPYSLKQLWPKLDKTSYVAKKLLMKEIVLFLEANRHCKQEIVEIALPDFVELGKFKTMETVLKEYEQKLNQNKSDSLRGIGKKLFKKVTALTGEAVVDEKRTIAEFLRSHLDSNESGKIPCKAIPKIIQRLVFEYGLNPVGYERRLEEGQQDLANLYASDRNSYKVAANYYKTNTNIAKSLVEKEANSRKTSSKVILAYITFAKELQNQGKNFEAKEFLALAKEADQPYVEYLKFLKTFFGNRLDDIMNPAFFSEIAKETNWPITTVLNYGIEYMKGAGASINPNKLADSIYDRIEKEKVLAEQRRKEMEAEARTSNAYTKATVARNVGSLFF